MLVVMRLTMRIRDMGIAELHLMSPHNLEIFAVLMLLYFSAIFTRDVSQLHWENFN